MAINDRNMVSQLVNGRSDEDLKLGLPDILQINMEVPGEGYPHVCQADNEPYVLYGGAAGESTQAFLVLRLPQVSSSPARVLPFRLLPSDGHRVSGMPSHRGVSYQRYCATTGYS